MAPAQLLRCTRPPRLQWLPPSHPNPCSGSFYPGTGAAHEAGEGPGAGYTVNVPWPCGGMRNGDYLAAFQHVVLPIAYGEERQGGQKRTGCALGRGLGKVACRTP